MSTHEDRRLDELDQRNSKTIREADIALCTKTDCQEEMHATSDCDLTNCWHNDDPREKENCEGQIETHKNKARCKFHADKYWDDVNQINHDYPDSDIPPSWFDPTLAGERWDDDY